MSTKTDKVFRIIESFAVYLQNYFGKAINKESLINEIKEYKRNGESMSFAYGDVRLPVIYRKVLGIIAVKMPSSEVFILVDYQMNLFDNLANLQDKLREKYPELIQ